MIYRTTVIGVSDPKLAATRAALRAALSETDDRGTRFYIREALQHLVVLESRNERDDAEADDTVPALPVGPHDESGEGREVGSLRAAEFRPDDLDRN